MITCHVRYTLNPDEIEAFRTAVGQLEELRGEQQLAHS